MSAEVGVWIAAYVMAFVVALVGFMELRKEKKRDSQKRAQADERPKIA
jgi:hypothetical protein